MIREEIIKINDLNFSIGNKRILKDVSLTVNKGEFVGLIGPNGAGKTTLLKNINGINTPDSGDIIIRGKNLNRYKDRELAKTIALMNQNTSISFGFKCGDIVLMGRYPYTSFLRGYSYDDNLKVERYMEYTNTLQFKDRNITELSGGERQRVLFAKVLSQETDIILLDEPTASLDICHEEQIFSYSKELVREGKTVIASIHDLRTAIKYCDRLIMMGDGNVVKEGSPDEVITEGNLREIYNIKTQVYMNPVSKMLDFHVH